MLVFLWENTHSWCWNCLGCRISFDTTTFFFYLFDNIIESECEKCHRWIEYKEQEVAENISTKQFCHSLLLQRQTQWWMKRMELQRQCIFLPPTTPMKVSIHDLVQEIEYSFWRRLGSRDWILFLWGKKAWFVLAWFFNLVF